MNVEALTQALTALALGGTFLYGLYRFVRVTHTRDDQLYNRVVAQLETAEARDKQMQTQLQAALATQAQLQSALSDAQTANRQLTRESLAAHERITELTESVSNLRHTVASLERVIDALMEVVAAANDAGVVIPPGVRNMLRDHRFARLADDIEHEGKLTIDHQT